jgi:hypothetical protein
MVDVTGAAVVIWIDAYATQPLTFDVLARRIECADR